MELDLIEYDIDPEARKQVESILQNLFSKTFAKVILLTDDAGRIISIKGRGYDHTEAEFLASLMSGIFGAAIEMSKMIKTDELEVLQYESKSADVIIKYIKPRFLLGVIVSKKIAIGTVRLFLREASDALERVLGQARMVPVREIKMSIKELEEKLRKVLRGEL